MTTNNTTARFYTLPEIQAALERLIRLGMSEARAREVVAQAFPEHRSSIGH